MAFVTRNYSSSSGFPNRFRVLFPDTPHVDIHTEIPFFPPHSSFDVRIIGNARSCEVRAFLFPSRPTRNEPGLLVQLVIEPEKTRDCGLCRFRGCVVKNGPLISARVAVKSHNCRSSRNRPVIPWTDDGVAQLDRFNRGMVTVRTTLVRMHRASSADHIVRRRGTE